MTSKSPSEFLRRRAEVRARTDLELEAIAVQEQLALERELRAIERSNNKKGRTHLIIGDSHADPRTPNHRYDWLGNMIADLRPDVVIDIGDFFSMEGLSRWQGPIFPEEAYDRDIEAGQDAQARLMAPAAKAKGYEPEWIRCIGNHEYRIVRAQKEHPKLMGRFGLEDLAAGGPFRWRVAPFLMPVRVDGISYCHYVKAPKSDKPIGRGAINAARNAMQKQMASVVFGHSHHFSYHTEANAHGRRIMGLEAGCYMEPSTNEHYAGTDTRAWWRGINVLKDVRDGYGHLAQYSIREIKERWG